MEAGSDSSRSTKVINGIIAISVGTYRYGTRAYRCKGIRCSNQFRFILKIPMTLAGGKNIVNTILGDFRAFDTMLEVVVLFIAGIGVYTLIKLKARKGEQDVEDQ